jgi:NTE family protein
VVGISIGAINAALIAGNAPERRVDRLREFWDLVSAQSPFVLPAAMDAARPMMNRMAAGSRNRTQTRLRGDAARAALGIGQRRS